MTIVSVPTPNITTLVDIADQIRDLEARRTRVLAGLVEDCAFMDTPVIQLDYFDVDVEGRAQARPGDLFHIVSRYSEWAAGDDERLIAHLAATCTHEWCHPGERVKFPKHSHVGSRTFHTRQADHILAGVERVEREKVYGKHNPIDVWTFIPATIERAR